MKKYLNPEVTVLCLDAIDVICASGGTVDYETYVGDPAKDAPTYWASRLNNL